MTNPEHASPMRQRCACWICNVVLTSWWATLCESCFRAALRSDEEAP